MLPCIRTPNFSLKWFQIFIWLKLFVCQSFPSLTLTQVEATYLKGSWQISFLLGRSTEFSFISSIVHFLCWANERETCLLWEHLVLDFLLHLCLLQHCKRSLRQRILAYSIRTLYASAAFLGRVPISDVCRAVTWSSIWFSRLPLMFSLPNLALLEAWERSTEILVRVDSIPFSTGNCLWVT